MEPKTTIIHPGPWKEGISPTSSLLTELEIKTSFIPYSRKLSICKPRELYQDMKEVSDNRQWSWARRVGQPVVDNQTARRVRRK